MKTICLILSVICGILFTICIALENTEGLIVFGVLDIMFYLQFLDCKIEEIKNNM
mgnify:CR=1 FL=1